MKGILGITILAAQRATGKTNKGSRVTHRVGFALKGMKNLGNPEGRHVSYRSSQTLADTCPQDWLLPYPHTVELPAARAR